MAVYKTVDAEKLDADLETVADAMRRVSGNTETLSFPSGFRAEMDNASTEITTQASLIEQIKSALLAELPSRLPEGYREVAYIESTGAQHFKTGIYPTNQTRIVTEVSEWPTTETSTCVFGTQSGSSDRYDLFVTADGEYRSYWHGSLVTFANSYSNKFNIDRNGNAITVGSETLQNTAATFACTTELYLFAHNNNGSPSKQTSLKMDPCTIYEGTEQTRNYVPCVNPDGEVGFYDLVNKTFGGSASTTPFIAGPEV